jgi:hypothetical protein
MPGIKLLFWMGFIYKLGLIGLPLALLLNYFYDRLMLRFLKLEPLSANDYTFSYQTPKKTRNSHSWEYHALISMTQRY